MSLLKNLEILVVDDESMLRGAIRFELEMEGAIVTEAECGRDALKIIKEKPFHMILTDVRMPNGDGIELLDNIKKLNPMTPVVMFITGYTDLTPDLAYQKGCAGFISKPFDPEVFIKLVCKAMKPHPSQWAEQLERFICTTDVKIEYTSFEKAIKEKILNISKGGMFVSSKNGPFPEVGSGLNFTLTWEEKTMPSIEGQAIVRWVRTTETGGHPPGYGVEFCNMKKDAIATLSEIIEKIKDKIPYIPAA